jgi:hypothetical protein
MFSFPVCRIVDYRAGGGVVSYLELGCRGVLAGVFLVSLAGKLRGPAAYRGFVTATGELLGVGARRARSMAVLAVVAEGAVLGLLVVGLGTELAAPGTGWAGRAVVGWLGFGGAGGLLVGFSGALVRALRRGTGGACHCFGASTTPVGRHHVVRNAVLLLVAVVGLAAGPGGGGSYQVAGVAVTGLAVAACVAVTARLDDLVALFRTT